MQLHTYTINIIITILSSVAFGSIVTFVINRKKIRAETQLFNTEIYSTMLGDLRAQINMQGNQLKNQAEQILNLQKKESEYVKIIKNNQMREREYIVKIKLLEKALKESEEMLKGNTNEVGSREGDGVYRKIRLTRQIYAVTRFIK